MPQAPIPITNHSPTTITRADLVRRRFTRRLTRGTAAAPAGAPNISFPPIYSPHHQPPVCAWLGRSVPCWCARSLRSELAAPMWAPGLTAAALVLSAPSGSGTISYAKRSAVLSKSKGRTQPSMNFPLSMICQRSGGTVPVEVLADESHAAIHIDSNDPVVLADESPQQEDEKQCSRGGCCGCCPTDCPCCLAGCQC